MRRLGVGLLAAVIVAQAAGCTSALKKGTAFVFGPTADAGEWMSHDCWNQRDAKEGGSEGGEPPKVKEGQGR
jgi:hypothetical protein